LFLWLAEILLECIRNSEVNKMGVNNLAVVTGPVLAREDTENPLTALIYTGQAVDIMQRYLNSRIEETLLKKE